MKSSLFILTIFSLACGAAAAQAPASSPAQKPRWALGLGAAVSDSVYAGEGTRVKPVPLLTYEGKRFFWRGIGGGIHLLQQDGLSLDATLSGRMDGIDRKDFGTRELAERGVNRALLEDRDDGLDLGLAATWRGSLGQLELGLKQDITGASKGYEASLKYGYPLQWAGARIVPNVGISHMSKKLANYYYGTLPEEVARGVVSYQPGSAAVPRIGVDVMRPFAGRWMFIGGVSYKKLPSKLSDSPLVEKDKNGSVSAFFGVSRGF